MTRYRQTFVVEGGPGFVTDLADFLIEQPEIHTQGFIDRRMSKTLITWTAPELIIDVPTGLGASFRDAAGDIWVRHQGREGESDVWRFDDGTEVHWISDGDVALLLSESGAKILSRGYEGEQ